VGGLRELDNRVAHQALTALIEGEGRRWQRWCHQDDRGGVELVRL